ncbi:unnamed protein product [Ixodes persulcatus]
MDLVESPCEYSSLLHHAAARFRSCGRSCLNIQFGLTDRR